MFKLAECQYMKMLMDIRGDTPNGIISPAYLYVLHYIIAACVYETENTWNEHYSPRMEDSTHIRINCFAFILL